MQFREIIPEDITELFFVRTRTRENCYSMEELEKFGITETTVKDRLNSSCKGWLCQVDDSIVGFSIADSSSGELWVVAVLPEFEGRGVGDHLMSLAENWLWSCGCPRAWLTTNTNPSYRAYGFYLHRGWSDWKIENDIRYMQLYAPTTTSV